MADTLRKYLSFPHPKNPQPRTAKAGTARTMGRTHSIFAVRVKSLPLWLLGVGYAGLSLWMWRQWSIHSSAISSSVPPTTSQDPFVPRTIIRTVYPAISSGEVLSEPSSPMPKRRLVILISSIPRTPETLCKTLSSVLEPAQWENLTMPATAKQEEKSFVDVHILVHRHGSWNCPDGWEPSYSTAATNQSPRIYLTVREFSSHNVSAKVPQSEKEEEEKRRRRHASRQYQQYLQSLDFLQLLREGYDLLIAKQKNTMNPEQLAYSHVLLLDDDTILCSTFTSLLNEVWALWDNRQARSVHTTKQFSFLAHLGRGSSGVLIPTHALPDLTMSIENQVRLSGRHQNQQYKTIDKAILEWALIEEGLCTIRPTTIHLLHKGWRSSSVHPGHTWRDIDQCGGATNNRDWQSLSSTRLNPHFFSEHCVHPAEPANLAQHTHSKDSLPLPRLCSPFTSKTSAGLNSTIEGSSALQCAQCQEGYRGDDCGVPIQDDESQNITYVRRRHVAPLVVLLSNKHFKTKFNNKTILEEVVQDSRAHDLINLYVIGDISPREWDHTRKSHIHGDNQYGNSTNFHAWWTDNIYVAEPGFSAEYAWKTALADHPRYGSLAVSAQVQVIVDQLLPPYRLWTLKYYEEK